MEDQAARFVDTDLGHMSLNDCVYNQCRHCHDDGTHCEAFPGRIPDDILSGEMLHEHPYPGDDGVRFEPRSTPLA